MTTDPEELLAQRISVVLEDCGPMIVGELSRKLESSFSEINKALCLEPGQFTKNDRTLKWRRGDSGQVVEKRPGPFGPAKDLIPAGQELQFVREEETCEVALSLMMESEFSAMPVVNDDDIVVGVFTITEFTKRQLELSGSKTNLLKDPVRECTVAVVFIDPNAFIDTDTDWSVRDHVFVGTAEEPIGILTITDVWAVLNDFAEAFVLIFEIENGLRSLIGKVLGDDFTKLFEAVNNSDIRKGKAPVGSLSDFTFGEYEQAIAYKQWYPQYEKYLAMTREYFVADFKAVREIRNEVFHFKRQVTTKDTDRLRKFCECIRLANTGPESP